MEQNKIEGILKKSNQIRNELLLKNIAKNYNYIYKYSKDFGEEIDVNNSFTQNSITDGLNLYDYTHSNETFLGDALNKMYFPDGVVPENTYLDDVKIYNLYNYTHEENSDYHRYIYKQYFNEDKEDYSKNIGEGYILNDTHSSKTDYSKYINSQYFKYRDEYDINDGSILEDTHGGETEYSKDINHMYIDNKSEYSVNDGTILSDTHGGETEYSKDINHKYIDNKSEYNVNDGSILEDTHGGETEYSKDINHKYIDNKSDYDYYDAKILEDTHNGETDYSKDINHKYIDNKSEYNVNSGTLLNYTIGNNLDENKPDLSGIPNLYDSRGNKIGKDRSYSDRIFSKYYNYGRDIKIESVQNYMRPNWNGEYGYDNANLIDRTHSAKTEYSENIQRKYSTWANDYITYLDEVFGMDAYTRHVNYMNNLLAGHYIENSLRQTEPGIVRSYSVNAAMAGINTTNLNNFSGKDTQLGTVTNYMYSHLLYYGSIFNSNRKSYEKYLTPSLYNLYGNNQSNLGELSDILKVGVNEYRLTEDPGENIKIVRLSDTINTSELNLKYLTNALDNGKKQHNEEHPDSIYRSPSDLPYMDIAWTNNQYTISTNLYCEVPTIGVYFDIDKDGNVTNDTNNGDYVKIESSSEDSILTKTQKMFEERKINTMIGRFCSMDGEKEMGIIDTARTKLYGNAHGRNLMTKDAQDGNPATTNGYINPYCRDWTVFNQYSTVKNLVRPFLKDGELMNIKDVQNVMQKYRSESTIFTYNDTINSNGNIDKVIDKTETVNGGDRLAKYSVLNNNGFVNIAPSTNGKVDIEKCMFSIENLAWKDLTTKEKNETIISKEQIGPNGGRIMWFPPYGLSFQENVSVNWNDNTFIGRGEKVYTYTDTVRTGSLSFYLLIDHPAIINSIVQLDETSSGIKDVDAEILRFFAGCDIPNVPEKPENNEEEKDVVNEDIITTGSFEFNVYFPNNYSGTITKTNNGNDGIENNEPYWWEYILLGNNASLFDTKDNWIGYEMYQGTSITKEYAKGSEMEEKVKEGWIESCVNCNENLGNKSGLVKYDKANKETGAYCYKYRVDFDRAQILNSVDSYSDKNSYAYNSFLNDNTSENKYTFSEIIYCLLKLGKLKKSSSGNYTEEDIISYLEEKQFIRIDNCTKLIEIMSNETFSIDNININGSATKRDSKYSEMMAKRRAHSVKTLFKDYSVNQNSDTNIPELVDSQMGGNISCEEDKKQREVLTTITYKVTSTQKLSDSDSSATNDEMKTEEEKKQEMFDVWYESLSGNSELIRCFENGLPTGEFVENLKSWMEKNEYSYNIEDYKDDNDWIGFILDYTNEQQNEGKYLVPAFCIGSGDTFMNILRSLEPLSDEQKSDSAATQDAKEMVSSLTTDIEIINSGITENILSNNTEILRLEEKNTEITEHIKNIKLNIEENNKLIEENKNAIFNINTQLSHEEDRIKRSELLEVRDTLEVQIKEKEDSNKELNGYLTEETDNFEINKEKIKEYENENKKLNEVLEINNYKKEVNNKFINNLKPYDVIELNRVIKFYNVKNSNTNFNLKDGYEQLSKNGYWIYKDYNINYSLPIKIFKEEIFDSSSYKLSFGYLKSDYLIINKLNDIMINYGETNEDFLYYLSLKTIDNINYDELREELFVNDNMSRIYNTSGETEKTNEYITFFNVLKEFERTSSIENIAYWDGIYEVINSGYKLKTMNDVAKKIIEYTKEKTTQILDEIFNLAINEKRNAYANKEKRIQAKNANILKEKQKLEEEKRIREQNAYLYKIYGRGTSTRYETEADYFNKLDKDSPLIFKKLKEKFKYFNPAFHSISPEGFNARLNFLQQCTRQGSTVEPRSTNGGAKPAGNLAFGRMPVCVLRIGDFIKTKVIINSVNIDYNTQGDTQWDLNPEGIGVQPMYAKISLQVTLLGGQSLAGPISRLQNAVSFNYYANTEVYDDRADIIEMKNRKEEYLKLNAW